MSELDDIKKLSNDLKDVSRNFSKCSRTSLSNAVQPLLNELRKTSPVRSGTFRSGWVAKVRQNGDETVIHIYNTKPIDILIEEGSPEGERPWPRAVARPAGTTVELNGRIFPDVSPDGPLNIVFKSFDWNDLHKNIADSILGKLHG